MVPERRPPKTKALIGTPAGSSHSASITGFCSAGAVKRALGWAALASAVGRPVVALPVDQVRGRLAVMPSHHTSPSSVSATLVKIVFSRIDAIALGLVVIRRARGDAEVAGLGVDRVELAVVAPA